MTDGEAMQFLSLRGNYAWQNFLPVFSRNLPRYGGSSCQELPWMRQEVPWAWGKSTQYFCIVHLEVSWWSTPPAICEDSEVGAE